MTAAEYHMSDRMQMAPYRSTLTGELYDDGRELDLLRE